MALNQLKESVDNIFKFARDSDVGNYPVVVILDEPSVGARACTEANCIYQGFDFENGRINIGCRDKLVRLEHPLMEGFNLYLPHKNNSAHRGLTCREKIANGDCRCRECYQKFEENIK